ncbi:MAG: AAA family ATPase [Acidimicrobiales bacterium]
MPNHLPSPPPGRPASNLPARKATELFEDIVANMARVIQGKDNAIRLALVCLMAQGHVLIEDVPGVGKTSLAKALASSIACDWQRIQFTPDLLPSDITGVNVFNRSTSTFEFRPGAVFANIVLGDEINRASPKTQSALLEAMGEGQVTVDRVTYRLPAPFMVIATQNPIEHEGTYPLPESQLDRFLLQITMGYPDRTAERAMLEAHGRSDLLGTLTPVAGSADVANLISGAHSVFVAPTIQEYLVDLAQGTRAHPGLALGMSPRSGLALQGAARAWAWAQGRDYVVPDDIKELAQPVLGHRMVASLRGAHHRGVEECLNEVLNTVPVPVGQTTQA